MDWITFGVQWLHVLMGIVWFGMSLTTNLVFVPAIAGLPLEEQRRIGISYGQAAGRVARVASLAVIVLGLLRGTIWGPIKDLNGLTSTYGLTWLVAFVVAVLTAAWGERVITPTMDRLLALDVTQARLPDGRPTPAVEALVRQAKRNTALELVGFFIIFSCMILMRFGL